MAPAKQGERAAGRRFRPFTVKNRNCVLAIPIVFSGWRAGTLTSNVFASGVDHARYLLCALAVCRRVAVCAHPILRSARPATGQGAGRASSLIGLIVRAAAARWFARSRGTCRDSDLAVANKKPAKRELLRVFHWASCVADVVPPTGIEPVSSA